ncbi:MAG: hypothetical protein HYR73_00210 [Candidatus Eisenbacteria bacterium]|nr:hypothetical protein [Candidatus Eisenbacteria bacterium]
MSEELDRLWALRALDEEAAAIDARVRQLPALRAQCEERVRIERAALDQLRARIAQTQKSRRAIEKDIESLAGEERKFQSQLPAIKKNEEYTALLHEIATVRQKRSDLETEVLMSMEAEESAAHDLPKLEKAAAQAERDGTERLARYAAAESADREQLTALHAGRGGHVEALPPATRSRYERVYGSREGRAVVGVVKGACGGCFRALPPQTLQEARRRDRVLSCEGCGRLVVWAPDPV